MAAQNYTLYLHHKPEYTPHSIKYMSFLIRVSARSLPTIISRQFYSMKHFPYNNWSCKCKQRGKFGYPFKDPRTPSSHQFSFNLPLYLRSVVYHPQITHRSCDQTDGNKEEETSLLGSPSWYNDPEQSAEVFEELAVDMSLNGRLLLLRYKILDFLFDLL